MNKANPSRPSAAGWLLILAVAVLAAVPASAERLHLAVTDLRGDSTHPIDVVGMVLAFDDVTGAYEIWLQADQGSPFSGTFRVDVHLYNPDAPDCVSGLLADIGNDFTGLPPTVQLVLTGTDPSLSSWEEGDRVAGTSTGLGIPPCGTEFATVVVDPENGSNRDVVPGGQRYGTILGLSKPLFFAVTDFVEVQSGESADVTSVVVSFDPADGGYDLHLFATTEDPFAGDLDIFMNFFNADLGTTACDPSFFRVAGSWTADLPPASVHVLSGVDERLTHWGLGDRAAPGSLGLGNPDCTTAYGSIVAPQGTSDGDWLGSGNEFGTISSTLGELFSDGFESGNTSAWSSSEP